MSSTIDNINTNILVRISELQKIINIYSNYELDEKDEYQIEKFKDDLDEILSNYELGSIDILKEYYGITSEVLDEKKQQDIYYRYMKFIGLENIPSRLKRIYMYCQKCTKYEINEPEIYDAFRNYEYANIDISYNDETGRLCTVCNAVYSIESKTSEMICKSCGNTEKLWGMVFEDEQFFYQEGQRTKHGKYDPTKHCKFWVDRIQAKESTEIPERIICSVKTCIKRDNIYLDRLSCNMIRNYLKELKKTKYNDHVPLIRKIITGKEPAQYTDHELKLLYIYFSRVIQIYQYIKSSPNCPYHPFFIYKITEQILKKPEDSKRRKDILSAIHLQSRDTLIENDTLWALIVEHIPEFTYIPTDGSR